MKSIMFFFLVSNPKFISVQKTRYTHSSSAGGGSEILTGVTCFWTIPLKARHETAEILVCSTV